MFIVAGERRKYHGLSGILDLNPTVLLSADIASSLALSGSDVTSWTSLVGGYAFTTAAGSRPTSGSTKLNGRNTLSFSAAYLTSSSAASTWKFLHDGTQYIVGVVAKFGASSNPDTSYGILGTNGGSSVNVGTALMYDDRSSGSKNDRAGIYVANGTNAQTPVNAATADNFIAANTWACMTFVVKPSDSTAANRGELYVGTGAATKSNTYTYTPSSNNPAYTLQIGTWGNALFPLTGGLAELVIVKSGAEAVRTALRDSLRARWGL